MSEYYLKKNDEVYGPAELALLQGWAADGRIGPDDALSESPTGPWQAAWKLPGLDMNWEVVLSDQSIYGPVHILALRHSLLDESLDPETHVKDRDIGQTYPLSLALCIGLIEQNRLLEEHIEQLESEVETLGGDGELDDIEAEVAKLTASNRRYAEEIKTLRMQVTTQSRKPETVAPTPAPEAPSGVVDKGELAKWKGLYEELSRSAQEENDAMAQRLTQLETEATLRTEQENTWTAERDSLRAALEAPDTETVQQHYADLSRRMEKTLRDKEEAQSELAVAKASSASTQSDLENELQKAREDADEARAYMETIQAELDHLQEDHRQLKQTHHALNERIAAADKGQ